MQWVKKCLCILTILICMLGISACSSQTQVDDGVNPEIVQEELIDQFEEDSESEKMVEKYSTGENIKQDAAEDFDEILNELESN